MSFTLLICCFHHWFFNAGIFEVGRTPGGLPFYRNKATQKYLAIDPNGTVYMSVRRQLLGGNILRGQVVREGVNVNLGLNVTLALISHAEEYV